MQARDGNECKVIFFVSAGVVAAVQVFWSLCDVWTCSHNRHVDTSRRVAECAAHWTSRGMLGCKAQHTQSRIKKNMFVDFGLCFSARKEME